MAAPVAPTVPSLCIEAYRRCGVQTPTTDQITRATNEWFEDVKRDIATRKDWHTTDETMVIIPQSSTQVYAMPAPVMRIKRVRFYRGTKKGTAQAGSTSGITIAAGTGDPNDKGKKIFITGGTGAAQAGRIVLRSGDVYSISCPWGTQPNSNSTYMIADTEKYIEGPSLLPMHGISPGTAPTIWNFVEANFQIWPPLDSADEYALEIDGEVDLSLIDTQDARIVRLLREWREPLVRGLMVHIKEDQDDLEVDRDERKFEKSVVNTMKQDVRKRLRGEAPAFRTVGGTVRRRR